VKRVLDPRTLPIREVGDIPSQALPWLVRMSVARQAGGHHTRGRHMREGNNVVEGKHVGKGDDEVEDVMSKSG
jgi:hypothetical protein